MIYLQDGYFKLDDSSCIKLIKGSTGDVIISGKTCGNINAGIDKASYSDENASLHVIIEYCRCPTFDVDRMYDAVRSAMYKFPRSGHDMH